MFLIFFILIFIYAYRLRVLGHPAFVMNLLFALLICILAFLEIGLLNDGYLYINSDEAWFAIQAKQTLHDILGADQRYLLYKLYSYSNYMLADEWVFKIQSLPFALLTCLVLFDATKKKSAMWLFPIVFAYLYFLATLNMRDMIIVCAMLFFSLKASRSGTNGIIFWSGLSMLFFSLIRPEFTIVWFILMLVLLLTHMSKISFTKLFSIPILSVVVLYVFFPEPLIYVSEYLYPKRIGIYTSNRMEAVTNVPFLNANAASLVRQLFTPLPTSKLSYMLTEGITPNLIIMEIFRMILMMSFYLMSALLLFKWKKVCNILKNNRFLQVLFTIAVINTILYAIYRDGGGSSRNKLYPIMFAYVTFITLYVFRIEQYIKVKLRLQSKHKETIA